MKGGTRVVGAGSSVLKKRCETGRGGGVMGKGEVVGGWIGVGL